MPQTCFELENHGLAIRGSVYRPAGAGRHPTVVMLHGFTGQRAESGFLFVQLARALATRGVASVTFDFRHSGESDGSFDQMLVTGELDDALRITQWVTGQPFVDRSRLGLLGFSLGGLLAACTVARTPAYKALALLAPTTERNLARIARTRQADDGSLVVGAYRLHGRFLDDLLMLDCVGDVVKHPRPTLLVQGDADTAVPPAISQQFVDAMTHAGVPVEHRLIAGAEHTFATPSQRQQVMAMVGDFFARRL